MPELLLRIRNKTAKAVGTPSVICGNSDYTVIFDFDHEWESYDAKTARFVRRNAKTGKIVYNDVLFEGNAVLMPPVYDTDEVLIGVYAGDIRTTTAACVPCIGCITDGAPLHPEPTFDIWTQVLAYLEKIAAGDNSLPHCTAMLSSFPADAPETGIPECISEPA